MKIFGKRIRKRHIAFTVLLSYIIVCQSCMTMRSTPTETEAFFEKSKVKFTDGNTVVDGQLIHYIKTGSDDKPTLFFVHGSPGSWNAFQKYLADSLLLQKYRMVSVDRPGFGYSDFGKSQNVETNAEMLSGIAKSIQNGKPVILVGHSLGGPIVVEMMADNPVLFDKLVILAGSVDPKQEEGQRWRYLVKVPPIRYLVPGAMRFSNDELTGLGPQLKALQSKLRKISSDVLIVHGTKDPLVPFDNVAFLQKELIIAHSVKVIPIEGANHFIPWEHYNLIRGELLKL